MQQAGAEARAVQRRPEAVARAGEVMASESRIETWIDTDEEHAQAGGDDVADALVFRSEELRPARPV
jgi:hypothetical protein